MAWVFERGHRLSLTFQSGLSLFIADLLSACAGRAYGHDLTTASPAGLPPTRILMVEDDAVQRERMRGWLEGPQWTVREAENGREALKRIQESKPDVILLDLMMPEM